MTLTKLIINIWIALAFFTSLMPLTTESASLTPNSDAGKKRMFAPPLTIVAPAGNAVNSTPELIFSITKNVVSASQSVIIRNDQMNAINITGISLSGQAGSFTIVEGAQIPIRLEPAATATVVVAFSPAGAVGALSAQLQITTADGSNTLVELYGLSAKGLEGSNEPPLHAVAQTLGYNIDVGGTQLILSTGSDPIGDEALVSLFQKAAAGPVTMQPVARYSPAGLVPYGYYFPDGTTTTIKEIAVIDTNQGQTLNPSLQKGSLTFDPGAQAFGLYADKTSYAAQKTFTEDKRNTGPLSHAVRTYPVKNRQGKAIANTYLVCIEPASNGDYQDYVYLLTNVKPATSEVGLINNLQIGTGKQYGVSALQEGATYYIDRTYTFTSVPEDLAGATFIKTANDDKLSTSNTLLTFTLAQASTLYVAYDPRATALPAWLSDWTKTIISLGTTDPGSSTFDLYSKSFAAGEVTLGGALAPPAAGSEMNYLVIAQPGKTPATDNALIKINSGGEQVAFGDDTFVADAYFTGDGKSYTNTSIANIAGTTQDALYLSERSTNSKLGSFGYAIPVTNGSYTVKLHFAEIYWGATGGGAGGPGKRVFDVDIEGETLLADFDINQEVGTMTATVKTFIVNVEDQELNLNLTASVNQPKLSALEIFGQGTITTQPVQDSCAWNSLASSSLSKVEAQSAKVNGKLYVLAGFLSGLKITGTTEIYDPVANSWSAGAPMPTPVTHMGAAVIGQEIWIVAGFAGNHPGIATAKVQVYNTVTNTWREGPALPNPRGSGAAVYNKGQLHFFGGLLPDRQTDVGEHYLLDMNNITAGWQPATPMPNPRNHLSGASVDGKVYAIGGQYGHDAGVDDQKFLDMYDPATDQWTRLADLPSDRSHFEPGTMVHNGKIIIAGGRRGNFFFNDITEYDPQTNMWTERCKLPKKLLAPSVKVFGDQLIVANGGENGTCCPLNKTRWIPIAPENQPEPVSLLREAEDALLSGAKKASNNAGFSGTGFVDYVNASNDFIEWEVDVPNAGTYTLAFTYALAQGNRPLEIKVSGKIVENALSFPATGSWATWKAVTVNAKLAAGNNQVRATVNGQSGANVDYLAVTSVQDISSVRLSGSKDQEGRLATFETAPSQHALQLYPNPAENVINIAANSLMQREPMHIKVTDIRGKVVFTHVEDTKNKQFLYALKTAHLPAGVYFVEVRQGKTISVKKMIKQ